MDVWYPAGVRLTDTLPVLLFSPGWGQKPSAYHRMLGGMTAAGYAVLAVRHQYVEPFNWATNVAPLTSDLLAGLDFATRAQANGDSVFAPLDLRRVGAFGHSYGGTISAEACVRDPRVVAAMDLDGSVFGSVMESGAPCPVFLLLASLPWTERFRREPPKFYVDRAQGRLHEEMLYKRSPTAYWLTVRGLEHMSFTDAALTPDRRTRVATLVGLELDAARTHEMALRYLQSFFGRYLRSVPDTSVLVRSPYAFATLQRRVR